MLEFIAEIGLLDWFAVLLFYVSLTGATAVVTEKQWGFNKVTTSVQCEISSCPTLKHSNNTNFRCSGIAEASLSVSESSLGKTRSSSRDTSAH